MMQNRDYFLKAVRFQRTALENTFAVFTILQGHGDAMMRKSLDRMLWLPEDGKSACKVLSDTCMQGSENLQKFIDHGLDGIERLLASNTITPEQSGTEETTKKNRQSTASSRKPTAAKRRISARKPGRKRAAGPDPNRTSDRTQPQSSAVKTDVPPSSTIVEAKPEKVVPKPEKVAPKPETIAPKPEIVAADAPAPAPATSRPVPTGESRESIAEAEKK